CHSGLDLACPVLDTGESSISELDSRFRGNDGFGTKFVGDKPRRHKFPFGDPISNFFRCVPIYWGRIRSLFIVSILFLSLSAIQLFPFLELFRHSVRGNGISYQEATIWSFAPKDVLLFFLPDAYGYFLDMKKYWVTQCWFKTLYTGGLPFILSLIYFLSPHHPRHAGEPLCGLPNQAATESRPYKMCYFGNGRKLYLALMAFSLFLSLGKYNPLYALVFKYVPFFNGVRYPAKFLYIFILVLSITAGLGFQRLSEYSKDNEKRSLKHLLIIFSLISGSFLLFSALGHKEVEHFLKLKGIDFPDFNLLAINLHHAQRFLFYLALFFLLLRGGYEVRWKGWVKVLLIVFLAADLFGNMGYYGKERTKDYFKKTKSLEIISLDEGNYRVFSTAKTISMDTTILVNDPTYLNVLKEKNIPSINLFYHLHDIWGIDVIRVKGTDELYRAFVSAPSISTTHLIDLYGVKYITSVTPLKEDHKFELIYANLEGLQGKRKDLLKENTIKLYKNRNPLPRAWLVRDFRVMDSQTILRMMVQKEFRPDGEVLLEEEPRWISPLSGTQNQGGHRRPPLRRTNDAGEPLSRLPQKVQILSESNNRLDLQVNAEENSLLVLSDTYYPGWKAFVDGKETKIYMADYTFRAIPLNTGTHRVGFVYDPMSFKLGAGVTILGILGCIGMGWIGRRKGPPNLQ
ncbi:MAG: YfhO family protein, partial [Thermodesulfobacteriota bacterium]